MKMLKMNKYGSVLTGREFGVDTMKKIKNAVEHPLVLDFMGVNSLGSSFADEVLVPIANEQNNYVKVCNVKTPVLDCIKDVANDAGIKVEVFSVP